MSTPNVCPKCQSPKVVAARLTESKVKELGLPTFTLFGFQTCQDCKHIWEKSSPAWVWCIGILIGLGLFVPFICVVAGKNSDPGAMGGAGFLAALGFVPLVGSIRGLLRSKKT